MIVALENDASNEFDVRSDLLANSVDILLSLALQQKGLSRDKAKLIFEQFSESDKLTIGYRLISIINSNILEKMAE